MVSWSVMIQILSRKGFSAFVRTTTVDAYPVKMIARKHTRDRCRLYSRCDMYRCFTMLKGEWKYYLNCTNVCSFYVTGVIATNICLWNIHVIISTSHIPLKLQHPRYNIARTHARAEIIQFPEGASSGTGKH